jgi:hypothetical protein
MKHAAPAWFKYSPSLDQKLFDRGVLTPLECHLSLAYCPHLEVQFQLANIGLPYNYTSAGIRQLYIIRPEETSNGHWS